MKNRIEQAFVEAKKQKLAALMPYLTLGYPDRETSIEAVVAIAPYSDLLELGVPFSDPIADGPTVQHSTQVSLRNGTTTGSCLEMVAEIRRLGVETPILLMGYTNPILAYGETAYAQACASAGVDGLIVPDLPPEEGLDLEAALESHGLNLIHFLAPTSNAERIGYVLNKAHGFIYMVAVTGVTGARQKVSQELQSFVSNIRDRTSTPVAVGFGISTPDQAQAVGNYADGVIVGSALINAMDASSEPVEGAVQFVKALNQRLVLDGR